MIYGNDKSGNDPSCLYQRKLKRDKSLDSDTPSVSEYRTVKSYIIDSVQASALIKIKKKLDSIDINDIESLSDAKIITDIFATLDKIGRLERGEATDNINIDSGPTLRDIQNGIPIEANYERKDNHRS